jgi:hypothetical protein
LQANRDGNGATSQSKIARALQKIRPRAATSFDAPVYVFAVLNKLQIRCTPPAPRGLDRRLKPSAQVSEIVSQGTKTRRPR